MKLLLKTLGKFSCGISLGFGRGFDSGWMMDYIYDNRPQGLTGLGKWLDRIYLRSPGWVAARTVKNEIHLLLREIVTRRRAEGLGTTIVDLAAGTGRIVLDLLSEIGEAGIEAVLRDIDAGTIEEAVRQIHAQSLKHVKAETEDAFSEQALLTLNEKPDIALTCGLFENVPDDEKVRKHFTMIRKLLRPDGFFIFTAQPSLPEQKFMAANLVNREGKPWVVKTRPVELLEEWGREAGFTAFTLRGDPSGIYFAIRTH